MTRAPSHTRRTPSKRLSRGLPKRSRALPEGGSVSNRGWDRPPVLGVSSLLCCSKLSLSERTRRSISALWAAPFHQFADLNCAMAAPSFVRPIVGSGHRRSNSALGGGDPVKRFTGPASQGRIIFHRRRADSRGNRAECTIAESCNGPVQYLQCGTMADALSPQMQCPGCGNENPPGAIEVCTRCGAGLTRCRHCGSANLRRFRHCIACGSFLVLHEVDAEGDGAKSGERKHVTVLFADIAGSLAMIQDSDPEDAHAVFDRTIEAVAEVVHSHGGTINRVLGDGVMALFGAPASLEHHAVKATTAALSILRRIDELNHRLEPVYGVRIRMHIGLDSGEVVVRSLSTDIHTEYDAVGRTAHVAARMLALAPAGTIRISAETARQVAGFIKTRSPGRIWKERPRTAATSVAGSGRKSCVRPRRRRTRKLLARFSTTMAAADMTVAPNAKGPDVSGRALRRTQVRS
ncbi:MAG: hypothetical protein EXQ95_15685 [Alphaproteobacteria bacterium]|nr:hypothetical protein [Alphaproteobacteria bacterium]